MACQWPVDYACLPTVTTDKETLTRQGAVDAAVGVLWALTGRRFGCCPVIVRPCPTGCADNYYLYTYPWASAAYSPWYPVLDAGMWRNVMCSCGNRCSRINAHTVHLPGPVCAVTEVRIDGIVLDPSNYRLEGNSLIRIGAEWPTQNMDVANGEVGSWSVTYTRGDEPPAGAARAVGVLAAEFYEACCSGKCKLPRRVQTVTRQGVTFQMVDPTDVFSFGATGLPEVDLWVKSWNPNQLMQPPAVLSPEYPDGL